MTSSQRCPYALGEKRATMATTMGPPHRKMELILKRGLSSDWSLQFDSMKMESLVIAYQPWRGEYVLDPCTHRPSAQESREQPKIRFGGFKLGSMIRGKS